MSDEQLGGYTREALLELCENLQLAHDSLLEQYHEVRAASREGLTDSENTAHPGTLDKIRFVRQQRDSALQRIEELEKQLESPCPVTAGQMRGFADSFRESDLPGHAGVLEELATWLAERERK